MTGLLHKTGMALVVLAVCCMAGCNIQQGAWVYVDNGTGEAMKVSVDGQMIAVVAPGLFERISAEVGPHQFTVTCGDTIIYDETKTIEAPENMFSPKRYLLNPDGNNRYWMYKIFYFDEAAIAALEQEDGTLGESYEELCGDYEVLPDEQWFRIPGNPYMFQDGPDELTSADDSTHVEAAEVVARVSEDNYEFLKDAEKVSNPTDKDLVNLEIMYDDSVIY